MAISQAMVIKLILDHVGGSKIKGNAGNVNIGGAVAMVKAGGSSLSGLGSVVTDLVGSYANVAAMTAGLQINPLASPMSVLEGARNAMTTQIAGITGLDGTVSSTLSSAVTSFNTSLTSLTSHSNLLSGLVPSIENIAENQLGLSDITSLGSIAMSALGMTKEEVLASANSLSSGTLLETITNSLDPNQPGGISEYITTIAQMTDAGADTAEIQVVADAMAADLLTQQQSIEDMIQADVDAQADLKLRVDSINVLASILPDPDNQIATAMFDLVASDELRTINDTLTATANT